MTEKAKRLSLAGIGSAISLLFIILSYYIEFISLSMNVLATSGIMLTLSQKYYREAILSVIVVSILGFLIINLGVLPFVLVGGSYTVFTIFWMQKDYNYYKSLPIKIAYAIFVFFILYKITTLIAFNYEKFTFLKTVNKTALYLIFNAVFLIAFIIYDVFLLTIFKYFKDKIITRILK